MLTAKDFDNLKNARDIALGAFGSKYEDENIRNEKIEPYKDQVNVIKRDALCDYILARKKELKFKDKNDLYGFFLLDVEMGDCFRTSRIVAGISSLQLYIHRCLINLEQSATDKNTKVDPKLIPQEEWGWMKNYRVWEANRKVFLYPENYILPDLRDNKTPIFKVLEEELLQEKITEQSVKVAYKKYLTQFAEVAKLKITGSYYHYAKDTYYFIGYTPTDPPQYYYREFINGSEWTHWEKIELAIDSKYVSAIVHLGKFYLFWVELKGTEKTDIEDGSSKSKGYEVNINLLYSYLDEQGKWIAPQRLEKLSENSPVEYTEFEYPSFLKKIKSHKCYPYIKKNKINIHYWDDFNLSTRKLDLYENILSKGDDPTLLPKKDVLILYSPLDRKEAALRIWKNNYDYEIWGDEYLVKYDTPPLITNRFSHKVLQPTLKRVLNRFGDFVLKLGDQQFLLKQTSPTSGGGGGNLYKVFVIILGKRSMVRLTTSLVDLFSHTLFYKGIDGFLNLDTQKNKEHFLPINITNLFELNPPNENKNHINFKGAYGTYYRELFFHIPFLIAYHCNANQKFKEAKYWYEKILNPTASETPEPAKPTDRNWRYIEFRDLDVPKMREILTDKKAIEAYKKDPFNPHAIARLRLSAYQKTIVMKYIDNLLDWGDYLFARDTMESINEATMLYLFASDLLGQRPVKLGECKTVSEDKLTYEKLGPAIDKGSEFLIELENWGWGNNVLQAVNEIKFFPSTFLSTISEGVSSGSASTAMTTNTNLNISFLSTMAADFQSNIINYSLNRYEDIAYMRASKRDISISKDLFERAPFPGYEMIPVPGLGMTKQKSTLSFCIPPNEDLLKYWDRVEDRLFKIRNCMNISGVRRELALFQPPIDPMMLVKAKAAGLSLEDILAMLQPKLPPYRFSFLIEKAKQFTSTVQSFGNLLLSALEKKDIEELNRLNNVHQQEILNMVKETKKQQLNESLAQLQSTKAEKQNVQNRIDHFNDLIEEGLTEWEHLEQKSKHIASLIRLTEGITLTIAAILYLVPQVGSPFAMKYGGKEMGDSQKAFADFWRGAAQIAESVAVSAGLEASHQRRGQEWDYQLKLANQEMTKMVQNEFVAQARVDIATNELDVHDKNIEQTDELEDFYKNKFTNLGLYNYLSISLNRLFREAYNVAYDLAKMAEQAYQFERDDDTFFNC